MMTKLGRSSFVSRRPSPPRVMLHWSTSAPTPYRRRPNRDAREDAPKSTSRILLPHHSRLHALSGKANVSTPMNRAQRHVFLPFVLCSVSLLSAASAQADIPTGYAGKPFDPAVAGGVGIIPTTVKAGPYTIP